jgi:hypothetical protein
MGRFCSLFGFAIFLALPSIRLQGNQDMTRQQAVSGDQISLELPGPDRHCLVEQPMRSRAEIDQR